MPRIRTVSMDGMELKISPLSYDEAESYIKEGREMLERQGQEKPGNEEWAKRTLDSVVRALNKAANGNEANRWDIRRLTSELDMIMINRLYQEFMEMSGLRTAPKGEDSATSTLP